jgi:hypothetical protein
VMLEQVLSAINQLSGWTEGAFSFHRADHAPPAPVSFGIPQIAMELMRREAE